MPSFILLFSYFWKQGKQKDSIMYMDELA